MISLKLYEDTHHPGVPLYHRPDCPAAGRFSRLAMGVWRAFPPSARRRMEESWQDRGQDPAFALVPRLPDRVGNVSGASPAVPGFYWRGGRLLFFNREWVERAPDQEVEAFIAQQLAHLWRDGVQRNGGEEPRFRRRLQRLVELASAGIRRKARTWQQRVRQAVSRCLRNRTRLAEGYKSGVDKRGHEYCRQDGTPVPCPRAGETSPAGPGKAAGKSQETAAQNRQTATDASYARRAAAYLEKRDVRKPAKAAAAVRELVGKMAAGAEPQVVTEAAIAGVLGLRLKSHEGRGFDMDGRIGAVGVLVDAKHSERIAGYSEKADSKISKIDEWEKKRRLPAYVALVPGRGVYLHVGIDPAPHPAFIGGKGGEAKRGLVEPADLVHYIDGSGKPLPFVELSRNTKSLNDMASITPTEIARIRSAMNRTLAGIKDMRKLNRHVEKQVETARTKTIRKYAAGDPATAAKAVAELDAEATVRAGLEKLTAKQRRATVRKLARGDAEATARAGLEAMGLSEEQIRHILSTKPASKS